MRNLHRYSTEPTKQRGIFLLLVGAVLLAAVMLILSAVGVLAATELKRRWR